MEMDEATIERIRAALAEACRELPVRLVVLFGSQALGTARPDSDVDIGVWFLGDTDYGALSAIIRAVEPIVGDREVDCVPLTWDNPTFTYNVADSCVPLYYRTDRDFVGFCLQAFHEYDGALEWRRAQKTYLDAWIGANT